MCVIRGRLYGSSYERSSGRLWSCNSCLYLDWPSAILPRQLLSRLFSVPSLSPSRPGSALFRPLVYSCPRVVAWPPLARPPRPKATFPVALILVTLRFFFLLYSSCLRVHIGLCWRTYLSYVRVCNVFTDVLCSSLALAGTLPSSRFSLAFGPAACPFVFLCASRK